MMKLYIIGGLVFLLAIQGCNICEKFHGKKKGSEPTPPIVVYDSAQIQSLNDTINFLQNKIAELENQSTENKGILDINDKDFYESVVNAPLIKAYESIQSRYYDQLVELLSAIYDYNTKDVVEHGNKYIEVDKDSVQILLDSIAGLQNRIDELENIYVACKAVGDINDEEFFSSIIKAPLVEKYDPVQVGYYEQLVELFDYKRKSKLRSTYNIYYPLLENYGKWNEEIAGFINRVVKTFELRFPNKPNSEYEKERFNKDLESCEYYYKYRWKKDPQVNYDYDKYAREIKYLENVIKDTKSLFDDPSKFKKENFEAQLRKLK